MLTVRSDAVIRKWKQKNQQIAQELLEEKLMRIQLSEAMTEVKKLELPVTPWNNDNYDKPKCKRT
jgi:hypothetical protein